MIEGLILIFLAVTFVIRDKSDNNRIDDICDKLMIVLFSGLLGTALVSMVQCIP